MLAAKGGLDVDATRERYPRVAELPFDSDYKFMATFHQMTDDDGREVVRCFVKGAPDQLLARAATASTTPDGEPCPIDDDIRDRVPGRERPARRAGPAGAWRPRAARLRPGDVRPRRRPARRWSTT